MTENSLFHQNSITTSKKNPAELSMTYKVSTSSKSSPLEKNSLMINEDMQSLTHYIDQYYPSKIPIPFRGNSLNLTSDKAYFIICSVEGRLAIINRLTKECINDVQLPGGGLYTTALYKNDEYVLTGGKEGIIRKFKLSTFEEVEQMKGHTDKISEVMFSPDETVLYSGSDDGTVRTWDLVNKSESVIIYTHSGRMLSMDLSVDGDYLLTGGADKFVKVYNTQTKELEAVLSGPTHSVWCVKLTKSKTMIAAGDNDACAYIWEFGTWNLLHKLEGHEKRVANIEFLHNDQIVVTSSNDHTVRFWDLSHKRKEIICKGHKKWIKSMLLDDDGEHVYTVSEDYTILKWKVPYMDFEIKLEGHTQDIKKIVYSHKRKLIYSACNDNMVIVWDFQRKIKDITHMSNICDIAITNDEKYLAVCLAGSEIVFWDLDIFQDYHIKCENAVECILISPCGKFIITGDLEGVTIKNYDSPVSGINSPPIATVKHEYPISALGITHDSSLLFYGDRNGLISVFDMMKKTISAADFQPKDQILSLKVSNDNRILLSGGSSSSFIIWNIINSNIEKAIQVESCDFGADFYFSKTKTYFISLSSEYGMAFWDSKTFTKIATVPVSSEGYNYSITCSSDEKYIIFSAANNVIVKENPIETQGMYLYGVNFCATAFMSYIRGIILHENPEYDPEMDGWLITPMLWNPAHIYAFFNLADNLQWFLENNGSLIADKRGLTPLDISIAKGNFNCAEIIIKVLIEDNKYSQKISIIENSLTALNLYGCESLHKLYQKIFINSDSKILQKSCSASQKLPIIILSKNSEIINSEFCLAKEENNEGNKEIEYYRSAIMIDMSIGSEGSIKFMDSVIRSPNLKVIDEDILYFIISYKWDKLKWMMRFIYFIYMILSLLFTFTFFGYLEGNLKFYYFQCFNMLITIFDIYLLIKTYNNKRITMFNDYSLVRLYILPFVLVLGNSEIIYSFLIFFSLLKSLSIFQLFTYTRKIVFSLQFVLDMIGDSFLIFICLLAISAVFEIFIGEWFLSSIAYFKASLLLENNEIILNPFSIVIFLILGFIIQVLFMNSLIAITRKNYPKYLYHYKYNEKQYLAEIILEGEKLWPFKCQNDEKYYIHVCDFKDNNNLELHKNESEVNEIANNLKSLKYIVNSRSAAELAEFNKIQDFIDVKKTNQGQNKNDIKDMQQKIAKLGELNKKITSLQKFLKAKNKLLNQKEHI